MELFVLDAGNTRGVVLTDYVCTPSEWQRAFFPYEVVIEEAVHVADGRQRLSGEITTTCPICGQIHSATRQYCEFDFAASPCPRCGDSWRAIVTSLKREQGSPADNITYRFEVELRCPKCESVVRRLVRSITGTLRSINKVQVGPDGIQIERTETTESK
jgi:uncharacterized C2H2 Zn-finger protein